MKRKELIAVIADLVATDESRRGDAIAKLEALPNGFMEEHPLPKKQVAPYIPHLARLLGSDVQPSVKGWCAQLIGESGIQSPELLNALTGTLADGNANVLLPTIWAIGEYGQGARSAADALTEHICSPNREIRWRAVWALERLRLTGQKYAEMFAGLFADADGTVRGYAVLGFIAAAPHSPWAVAQLKRAAEDPDGMPRIHAQRALEQWAAEGSS
jgi:HEAT repeat protein